MNFTLLNRWAVAICFGKMARYAIVPSIEYVPTTYSIDIIFSFWKWQMEVSFAKIKKGGI